MQKLFRRLKYVFCLLYWSKLVQESSFLIFDLLQHDLIAFPPAKTQQVDAFTNDTLLNFVVERRISRKARHLINLEQIRSQLLINHHVEAQDLEAHLVPSIVRLARPEQVVNMWLGYTHCLDDDGVDLLLHEVNFTVAMFLSE